VRCPHSDFRGFHEQNEGICRANSVLPLVQVAKTHTGRTA
jgi:hypothetical protein